MAITKSMTIRPGLLRWLFAVYWLAMFIGTHIPPEIPPLEVGWIDKLVHFTAFAGLALLFAWCWEVFGGRLTTRHYLCIIVVLAAYGTVDELLQTFVHRDCSLFDWLADVAGTLIGLWLFRRWKSRLVPMIGLDPVVAASQPTDQ